MVGVTWPFQVSSEKKIYVTMCKSLQHISNVLWSSIHAFWFIEDLTLWCFSSIISHTLVTLKLTHGSFLFQWLCGAQGFCFVLSSLLADDVDYKSAQLQHLLRREQQSGKAGGTEL